MRKYTQEWANGNETTVVSFPDEWKFTTVKTKFTSKFTRLSLRYFDKPSNHKLCDRTDCKLVTTAEEGELVDDSEKAPLTTTFG